MTLASIQRVFAVDEEDRVRANIAYIKNKNGVYGAYFGYCGGGAYDAQRSMAPRVLAQSALFTRTTAVRKNQPGRPCSLQNHRVSEYEAGCGHRTRCTRGGF